MARRTPAAVVAALLCACVLGGAAPVRAEEQSKETGARSRIEQKRDELKTKRAESKERRDARREERREDRKSFLERLWPFGKDKKEEAAPNLDRRFGTGNPRDTSSGDRARLFGPKKHSKSEVRRDGMNLVRKAPPKKHAKEKAEPTPLQAERRDDLRSALRKNGEFQREFGRPRRHAPTGLDLDWRLPQREKPRDTHSHKNGAYRIEKRRR